jgi:AcrR family transcriptional regulator
MEKKNVDRRVQKTRKLLQDALVELVAEKGLESIRIQDILEKANVGRSTFYTHFQDKHDLLNSCFEEIHEMLEKHLMEALNGNVDPEHMEAGADISLKTFRFAEEHFVLFKALLGKEGITTFIKEMQLEHVPEWLGERWFPGKRPPAPVGVIVHYYVYAFIGVLRWWVNENKPCTADEINRYFKQLAMPSVKGMVSSPSIKGF